MPYLSFFTESVENIENYTFCVICTSYMSQKSQERLSGWKKSACGSQEDLTKLILDSGEWLDEVDETFLRQLQNVSEAFHPLDLAIHLPIQQYGGGLRPPPQQRGAAFGGPPLLWIP